jgi:5'-methylthioadenosine phosphorylase
MKREYEPTQIVLPDQFLDLTKGRQATFFGDGCVAHVSFSHPVSAYLLGVLGRAADDAGAAAHRGGTYVCMDGPQFSTLAESRLYRSWGVDVIGMTNATEAKLCREAEIDYATVCLVTDFDCWHEEEAPVSVENVLAVLRKNAETADRVLARAVASLDPDRPPDCEGAMRFAVLTARERIPASTRERLALLMERYWK